MVHLILALIVALTCLQADASSAVVDSGLDSELLAVKELLTASEYQEALTAGSSLLTTITAAQPATPLREAQLLDLMVNAGYRSQLVMEQRFLDMAHRALVLNRTHAGQRSLPTATSQMHLANLLLKRGDLTQAIPQFEESISILAELGPDQDQQRAVLLCSEGVALRHLGELASARLRYEQALAIQVAELGADHVDVASTLNNLANILADMGQYREARKKCRRALVIRETALGPNHEWVAESLHNLANLDTDLGAYDDALQDQERAVAIFRQKLGEHHQRYLWARLNLGISYLDMGDFAGAAPICEEVLAAQQNIYGLEHIETTYALEALAAARFQAGQYDEALVLYSKSLGIMDATLGTDSSVSGPTLFQVGRCQIALGHVPEGTATMSTSLAKQETDLGPDSPELCDLLQNLSAAYLRLSRPADALGYARRSRDIFEIAVGTKHPGFAKSTLLEAQALAALGDTDKAVTLAVEAENISRRHLQTTMRALSEARALDYATNRVQGLDLAISLIPTGRSNETVTQVWDTVIHSRAIVLDEFTDRNTSLCTDPGTQAAALVDSSLAVRKYLANLSLRGPGYSDAASYRQTLSESQQELDRLERQISLLDNRLGQTRQTRTLGQAGVMAQLAPGTVLVSYVLYHRAVGDPLADQQEDHIMAFVADPGQQGPIAIELGRAAEITKRVKAWRDEVQFGSLGSGVALANRERGLVTVAHSGEKSLAAYLTAAGALRQAVWDPLQDFVADADRVFIVPAGVLHRVNFAALPLPDGKFMAERGPLLHTLMTERSLVRLANHTSLQPGVLAIGDPDFGRVPAADGTGNTRGVGLNEVRFKPLPNARQEVARLADIWRQAEGSDEVQILIGAAATEQAFKAQFGHRGILHLATHAFVLDRHALQVDSPVSALNLTGLALQGANEWAGAESGDEDGILTATEISALDMSHVDWAVLSACDTGLGDLTARGEGVFGLCRAFALAGARTVIVSLWPVGDESARDWMQALYHAHLVVGRSTEDSVRAADCAVLAARRARGLSVHPYYWAGFTAIGDWQ